MLPSSKNHQLICLTGGVATGKTRVGDWFESHGWTVVCTDKIVHELYEPGQKLPPLIEKEFGPKVLTQKGRVDRKILADIVFNDAKALLRLNEIVHPSVRDEWKKQAEISRSKGKSAMVMIPLAYETNVTAQFDQTWVVACNMSEQKKRLAERGISFTQVEQRIAAQMALQKKIDLADIVIWNNDSWNITESQLSHLINEQSRD
jgi:dephospho-CoA kinase